MEVTLTEGKKGPCRWQSVLCVLLDSWLPHCSRMSWFQCSARQYTTAAVACDLPAHLCCNTHLCNHTVSSHLHSLPACLPCPAICCTIFCQLGAVEVLLHIVDSASSRLTASASYSTNGASLLRLPTKSSNGSGSTCSRSKLLALLLASLGALAVLAVDTDAREHVMTSRVGLKLLADVAGMSAEVFQPLQH